MAICKAPVSAASDSHGASQEITFFLKLMIELELFTWRGRLE